MVKVFFAEHGTKEDLLATIASVRAVGRRPVHREPGHPAGLPRRAGTVSGTPSVAPAERAVPDRVPARGRAVGGVGRPRSSRRGPTTSPTAEPDWPTLEAMAAITEAHAARADRAARGRARLDRPPRARRVAGSDASGENRARVGAPPSRAGDDSRRTDHVRTSTRSSSLRVPGRGTWTRCTSRVR